ncbi:MAG: homocysteine S-methyltransferase family protein [Firmicutes bacterium]|nr:homocysteine S-methyltransferase family protein [Bacillota bacterium]
MNILDYLKDNILILDGGMGSFLQAKGLQPGERPEPWNISHPDVVTAIHRSYFDAGSNAVITNTFGACGLRYSAEELQKIAEAAVRNARTAAAESASPQPKWVGLDVGPCGKLLKPFGDLDFEDAVEAFAVFIRAGAAQKPDFIFIETMSDCYETKAAVLAAKENADLPIFASNAYSENGRLLTGADPAVMTAMLEGLGVSAMGMNCSLGPDALLPVAEQYLERTSLPVIFKANAGLPRLENGQTVYDVTPAEFAQYVEEAVRKGVRIVGGCCGTTPETIAAIAKRVGGLKPAARAPQKQTVISSYSMALPFGAQPLLIGERINPTGKKRLKQAILDGDLSYLLSEAAGQEEKGVHAIDVNVGVPGIDEPAVLQRAVEEIQAVTNLPLQLDSSDPAALEAAMRIYNGKPLVNSVNGKQSSMDAVFPLIRKYGGVCVALTLDDGGIPMDARSRADIAAKIVREAEKYGIAKEDLVFDTLAMPVSASGEAANIALDALSLIRSELGCRTSLGVSNISFGLPSRGDINSAFFLRALDRGLSAAIINPYADDMMRAYYAYRALAGLDESCGDYIRYCEEHPKTAGPAAGQPAKDAAQDATANGSSPLQNAIVKGFRQQAGELAKELLRTLEPVDLINTEIIPALNRVGEGFEKGRIYLPQLLMSAEAATSAFDEVKTVMAARPLQKDAKKKCTVVVATVQGDIHDIGKNIAKLLLESYGFTVKDLGKDVPPETILEEVLRLKAPVAGLSALMTTTVPAMQQTIDLLKKEAPWCRVVTGGAVLTKDFADSIGSDCYAKDAMDTVRYAQTVDGDPS